MSLLGELCVLCGENFLELVEAYRIKGESHDCGNKLGYMKAQLEYGLADGEIGEGFRVAISTLLESKARSSIPVS